MNVENNPIISRPSLVLIPNKVISYLDDKVNQYKKLKLNSTNYIEKIGVLTGFETVETNIECGGYCDIRNKEIALVEFSDRVFFHEISHAFQMDLGFFDNKEILISHSLKLEQQCESMAKYLYEKIYNLSGDKIFNSYFCKGHIIWLSNWYGDFRENDIL